LIGFYPNLYIFRTPVFKKINRPDLFKLNYFSSHTFNKKIKDINYGK
jgi:hypothetical protein